MIKIIEGDLLEATEDIIGHQVNYFFNNYTFQIQERGF